MSSKFHDLQYLYPNWSKLIAQASDTRSVFVTRNHVITRIGTYIRRPYVTVRIVFHALLVIIAYVFRVFRLKLIGSFKFIHSKVTREGLCPCTRVIDAKCLNSILNCNVKENRGYFIKCQKAMTRKVQYFAVLRSDDCKLRPSVNRYSKMRSTYFYVQTYM